MGRPLRQAKGGVVYHVLNRRVLRLPLFEGDGDYLAFVRVLGEAMKRDDAPELFGFCLMPNHWHLLVRPTADGQLPRWMQWLTVTHTHRWHKHHDTAGAGPVYQGRFKSFPVQTGEPFLIVMRYIEGNPLRANLVTRGQDWRWSSLGLRRATGLGGEERELRDALADWPVEAPGHWTRLVNRPQPREAEEALQRCVAKGTPFGSDQWVEKTAARLDLGPTLRPRGRPRKKKSS